MGLTSSILQRRTTRHVSVYTNQAEAADSAYIDVRDASSLTIEATGTFAGLALRVKSYKTNAGDLATPLYPCDFQSGIRAASTDVAAVGRYVFDVSGVGYVKVQVVAIVSGAVSVSAALDPAQRTLSLGETIRATIGATTDTEADSGGSLLIRLGKIRTHLAGILLNLGQATEAASSGNGSLISVLKHLRDQVHARLPLALGTGGGLKVEVLSSAPYDAAESTLATDQVIAPGATVQLGSFAPGARRKVSVGVYCSSTFDPVPITLAWSPRVSSALINGATGLELPLLGGVDYVQARACSVPFEPPTNYYVRLTNHSPSAITVTVFAYLTR